MSQLTVYADNNPTQPTFSGEEVEEISARLARVGVRFERWAAAEEVSAQMSQEEIMAAYRADIDRIQAEGGYQTVDVVSMYPTHPDRAAFRQKFLFEHRHTEDEVRFFVAGQGLFYLHIEGEVYEVLCTREDLISVPANTPHWFDMGSAPSFTAIRFFNNVEGWVAHATESDIARRFLGSPL